MPDEPRVPGAHEVTLGEVYRRQQETLAELREMRRDLIGRAEYESDRESVERRLHDLASGLADERQNRVSEDEKIRVDSVAAKRYAVSTAIAAGVLILGIVVFLLGLGGTPS